MTNKTFYYLALTISFSLAACDGTNSNDTTIRPRDVPAAAVNALNNKYPHAAEITWEREMDGADTVYEATFLYGGKQMDAEFDRNGNLAEQD